jgi:hypothetical protein
MLTPDVLSRVEKRDDLAGFGIDSCSVIGFSAIAVKAGQGQILDRVRATLRERYHVVNSESDILPLLRGMAIFTKIMCAFSYLLMHILRYLTAR